MLFDVEGQCVYDEVPVMKRRVRLATQERPVAY
jgi:hypothetical protein